MDATDFFPERERQLPERDRRDEYWPQHRLVEQPRPGRPEPGRPDGLRDRQHRAQLPLPAQPGGPL